MNRCSCPQRQEDQKHCSLSPYCPQSPTDCSHSWFLYPLDYWIKFLPKPSRHDVGVDQGHQQGKGPALGRSEHRGQFLLHHRRHRRHMNTHMTAAPNENTAGAIEEPTNHRLLVAAGPIPAGSWSQTWRCVEVAPPCVIVPIHRLAATEPVAQCFTSMQSSSDIGLVANSFHRCWPTAVIILFTSSFCAYWYPQRLAQRS
mmetsp:Transcript_27599/g.57014  ORF Transcript_27599/g.57014 Transcript_27599/m.57014 type:complete len:200 (-) Transcript_27599:391-990(-)